MKKAIAAAASTVTSTTGLVVSAGLRVQVNCCQAHHTSQATTAARAAPSQVRSCTSKLVTWVTAYTNTRSKKSSTYVAP